VTAQNDKPPGLKKFEPRPLKKQVAINPNVTGTAVVGLLAVLAWLVTLLSPVVIVARMVIDLRALIPEMARDAVYGAVDSFLQDFSLSSDLLTEFDGFWDLLGGVLDSVDGSIGRLVLGVLILAIVLILIFCMIAALRNNCNTARVLQIICFISCTISSYLFYSVIKRISETIGIADALYEDAPRLAFAAAIVAVVLWGISILIYFVQIEKSKSLNNQQ